MSVNRSHILELFERRLVDPESWPKLAHYCLSYIGDRIRAKDVRFEPEFHVTDEVTLKLLRKLPEKDYPELHKIFREWQPSFSLKEPDPMEELKGVFT